MIFLISKKVFIFETSVFLYWVYFPYTILWNTRVKAGGKKKPKTNCESYTPSHHKETTGRLSLEDTYGGQHGDGQVTDKEVRLGNLADPRRLGTRQLGPWNRKGMLMEELVKSDEVWSLLNKAYPCQPLRTMLTGGTREACVGALSYLRHLTTHPKWLRNKCGLNSTTGLGWRLGELCHCPQDTTMGG